MTTEDLRLPKVVPEKLPLTKHDKMTWELGQMTETSLFGGGSANCTNCKVSSNEKKNVQ